MTLCKITQMTFTYSSCLVTKSKGVRSSKCMSEGSFLKQLLLVIEPMEITTALTQRITKNMPEKKNVEIKDEFRPPWYDSVLKPTWNFPLQWGRRPSLINEHTFFQTWSTVTLFSVVKTAKRSPLIPFWSSSCHQQDLITRAKFGRVCHTGLL